jgi:hypothetical protein
MEMLLNTELNLMLYKVIESFNERKGVLRKTLLTTQRDSTVVG